MRDSVSNSNLALLSFSALGIVFGDIGTSPLYTFKTVLTLIGGNLNTNAILGSLSLIAWTLIIVTTIKYVYFAMRIDNDGEGGILALMSLLGIKLHTRPVIIAVGLFGAALIYGDGAITPAISVLSALEGLNIITPSFTPYILPLSVAILIALFAIQYKGTANIGKIFGPVMGIWFLTLSILGVWGILQHPSVLKALNPSYGLDFLLSHGFKGFLVLGGVFLCVTGAEALYADMGHFGAKPIRLAWLGLVFPSLVLNYAGQAALVLEGVPVSDNIFYRLCPHICMIPLVILATVATIIASQSIISGTFSMTRQAIQLGWLPRLRITQTSCEGYGQIYIGVTNWVLMIATVGLIIGFRKSDNLAAAYGIAVSATMLATSALLFIAFREIWNWSVLRAGMIIGVFLIIDTAFFVANLSKFMEGGYVPIIFAIFVYAIMLIWHIGTRAVSERLSQVVRPINAFMTQIAEEQIARVPGTAVFLTRTSQDAPSVLIWHVRQNRALQKNVFILKVETKSIPWVKSTDRIILNEIYPNVWRVVASYGFMEHPNIPRVLRQVISKNNLVLDDIIYYVGHATIISRAKGGNRLPTWIGKLYAFMQRNALHESEYFQLSPDAVVEIGRQVDV
ncbi:KUP system potassium uptake protein [Legionella steigerwaltii]|uniref:Probable potassium transport system protein Kup n=1 Tax=Legionella steigerwaltii TaxID=460 RepID=A0A378L813_9GAMM|nr:KUP/HAK/KT family potassium transporter [Legionella steigerwaltii]KTD81096.1 KUP system potassium uptake protein [Legionella steigerwaltii]STY23215.1 KUP system potassium uptake protein [Legionella steigerwaltii]